METDVFELFLSLPFFSFFYCCCCGSWCSCSWKTRWIESLGGGCILLRARPYFWLVIWSCLHHRKTRLTGPKCVLWAPRFVYSYNGVMCLCFLILWNALCSHSLTRSEWRRVLVVAQVWKVWPLTTGGNNEKSSVFFFFCAPSFTRVIFDFRQRKIKSERHTPATVAFQAASVSQHEKTKTARQTAREKSEAFCHSKHPPSPNNAVALPLQYIRNQLFMERSRELFNLFLLSN